MGFHSRFVEHFEGQFDVIQLVGTHLGGFVVFGQAYGVQGIQEFHQLDSSLEVLCYNKQQNE